MEESDQRLEKLRPMDIYRSCESSVSDIPQDR